MIFSLLTLQGRVRGIMKNSLIVKDILAVMLFELVQLIIYLLPKIARTILFSHLN